MSEKTTIHIQGLNVLIEQSNPLVEHNQDKNHLVPNKNLDEWLHSGIKATTYHTSAAMVIEFTNDDDLMAFRLRWMGEQA